MKVLVFGAGVIGSYLAHVLCAGGNDVTLLARGAWKENLERNGLVIRHHLQRRTTVDHPRIVGEVSDEAYDAAFAVMSYDQMMAATAQIARINAPHVVLVGNDLTPAEVERDVLARSADGKRVLFGFQATAGRREADRLICERAGAGTLDLGFLHALPDEGLRRRFESMFKGTGYKLRWQPDMEAYLYCHPAAILPIGYLAYACGGNLRGATRAQRRQMVLASREAYGLLRALGYPILPEGDDAFYLPGPRGAAMKLLYFVMCKTEVGELVACAHCRRAVNEMRLIDEGFARLIAQKPDYPMPVWNALKAQMPGGRIG